MNFSFKSFTHFSFRDFLVLSFICLSCFSKNYKTFSRTFTSGSDHGDICQRLQTFHLPEQWLTWKYCPSRVIWPLNHSHHFVPSSPLFLLLTLSPLPPTRRLTSWSSLLVFLSLDNTQKRQSGSFWSPTKVQAPLVTDILPFPLIPAPHSFSLFWIFPLSLPPLSSHDDASYVFMALLSWP